MKKIIILILINLGFCSLSAQNRNSVWVFGDSVGIDFSNTMSPQVFSSSIDTRGSCVSIADSNGNMMFYANTRASVIRSTQVWNNLDQLIQNGDSVNGEGWYHELVIIPKPESEHLFYLFSICVDNSCPFGLYYSIIDIQKDSVIQKNIPLQSFPMVDCLTAVKHGNGRDWWLIFRRWDQFTFNYNNEFHSYLISPIGITNYNVQMIGSNHRANQGELTFAPNGERLINTDGLDLLELFDFNRCTGILSNPVLIQPAGNSLNYHLTWSSAFSPNGNVLYVSTSKDTNYIYQLDLTASNIFASRINLDTLYSPPIQPGSLKLAPDGKIYLSCAYYDGVTFNYPYNNMEYDSVNMNLSVINYPDSLGTACGYSPFSFYLGGKRTYWGLPNNPDYDLGPLVGSPCDTLTSLNGAAAAVPAAGLYVYYSPQWQTAFINADKLSGTTYRLSVFDLMGKEVFSESGKITPPYFTKNLSCGGWAKGMYVVRLECDSYPMGAERLVKKFVVE